MTDLEQKETSNRSQYVFTQGRPPWYKADGQAKDAFLIGVCGGSASGKTSVAEKIIRELDIDWVVLLSMDSFYKELSAEEKQRAYASNYDFDHPDAFDIDLLVETLKKLKSGKSVEIPTYDFATHSRKKSKRTIYGANVVIFEGIMAFARKDLIDCLDLRIFVDTDADVRLARRLKRDICERGRDLAGVLDQYERFVRPSYDQFIHPSMKDADIVIPRGYTNTVAIDLIIANVKRQLREQGFSHRKTFASKCETEVLPTSIHILKKTPQNCIMQTIIRDRETQRDDFVYYAHRLSRCLVEEAHSLLPYEEASVVTPTGDTYVGARGPKNLIGVSVLRAGVTMEKALRDVYKDIPLGKILIQTNPLSGEPELHYCKLPKSIPDSYVFVTDATCATGSAAIMAIRVLLDHDFQEEHIIFLALLASRIGVQSVAYAFPKVKIIVAGVEDVVDSNFHLIPGVGNFGDRYYGTGMDAQE